MFSEQPGIVFGVISVSRGAIGKSAWLRAESGLDIASSTGYAALGLYESACKQLAGISRVVFRPWTLLQVSALYFLRLVELHDRERERPFEKIPLTSVAIPVHSILLQCNIALTTPEPTAEYRSAG